jgi:hypothetical protein
MYYKEGNHENVIKNLKKTSAVLLYIYCPG